MSRELSDQVANANDGITTFHPYRLHGLAARLLRSSNALYNKIDYRDGGSFAEPGTTHHAGFVFVVSKS